MPLLPLLPLLPPPARRPSLAFCAVNPDWPVLSAALRRWETRGSEAVLRETVVLKLAHAELLETLRGTASLRDYLGEAVGPAAVLVRPEHVEAVRQALAGLGILADE